MLVSHKVNLSQLGVTCHPLYMPGSCLWMLHLLCKVPDRVCRKLVQVYVAIINCLGDKLFIIWKEPKDVPMKYLGSFWGVLSQSNLGLYCIVPFIDWLVALPEACKKVKPGPYLMRLWLAELFKLLPWYQVLVLHWTKLQETYCSIPKSPLQTIIFMHCLFLVHGKLTLKGVLTLQAPLKESMIWTIIYCPIHLRTFYVGHEHVWDSLCLRLSEKDFWVLFLMWAWGLFMCAGFF